MCAPHQTIFLLQNSHFVISVWHTVMSPIRNVDDGNKWCWRRQWLWWCFVVMTADTRQSRYGREARRANNFKRPKVKCFLFSWLQSVHMLNDSLISYAIKRNGRRETQTFGRKECFVLRLFWWCFFIGFYRCKEHHKNAKTDKLDSTINSSHWN